MAFGSEDDDEEAWVEGPEGESSEMWVVRDWEGRAGRGFLILGAGGSFDSGSTSAG
jgi:hypothetical protein